MVGVGNVTSTLAWRMNAITRGCASIASTLDGRDDVNRKCIIGSRGWHSRWADVKRGAAPSRERPVMARTSRKLNHVIISSTLIIARLIGRNPQKHGAPSRRLEMIEDDSRRLSAR